MATDPFESFERSRAGWSIPAGLFILGAFLTFLAVNSLHAVVLRDVEAARTTEPDLNGQGGDSQSSQPKVAADLEGSLEGGADSNALEAPEQR